MKNIDNSDFHTQLCGGYIINGPQFLPNHYFLHPQWQKKINHACMLFAIVAEWQPGWAEANFLWGVDSK